MKVEQLYSVTYSVGQGCNVTNEIGTQSLAGQTIVYDGEVKFKATLNAGLENSRNIDVKMLNIDGTIANDQPESLADNIYQISELKANQQIVVTAADITHKVTLATNTGKEGYRYSSYDGTDIVTHNGTFRFYVTPIEGYEVPEVYVVNKSNPTEDDLNEEAKLNSVGGNLYVCNNITQDKFIYIKNVSINNYNVHFSVGTGYTLEENKKIENNNATVDHGESLNFKINVTTGYDKPIVIANNNKVISLAGNEQDGYTGTLESVKEDTVVNITGSKLSYEVKFEDSVTATSHPEYTYSGDNNVKVSHGDKYTFYVTPAEGYSRPIVTINRSRDPINPVDGSRYEITITDETTIKIQAGAKDTRTVTFTDGIGYYFADWGIIGKGTLSGDDKIKNVPYGEGIKFKVKLNEYYSDSNMLVLANGTKLEKEGDYYKLENITKDQTITVSGVEKPVYTVTFTQGESYTISSTEPTKVTAGEYFTFTVSVTAGYEGTLAVKVNEDSVEDDDEDGYYKVQITKNTVIRAEGLTQKFYKPAVKNKNNGDDINAKVTFTKPEGVAYREKCEFTVDPKDYYKLVQVAYDGTQLTPVGDKYTIPSVTNSDAIITVVTEPVKLTVHYVDDRYNTSITDKEFTINDINDTKDGEISSDELDKIGVVENRLYTFDGWDNADKAVIDTNNDTEIILTAKWKLNENVVKKGLSLETTGNWSTQRNEAQLFEVLFKTIISLAAKDNAEYTDNVKIKAFGTLYSNKPIEDANQHINKIKNRGGIQSETLMKDGVIDGIYNYYKNLDTPLSVKDLGEKDFFLLKLTARERYERHAVGWLEVEIDGETVIVINKESVQASSN